MLSSRLTEFLGEISFSLYLLHPRLNLMLKPLYSALPARLSAVLCFGDYPVATFCVLVPVAYLTYRLIDVPGMSLVRTWATRIEYGERLS